MNNYNLNEVYSLNEQTISNEISDAQKQVLNSQTKLAITYNNLAITFQEQGNFEQAITHYQKALEFGSNLSNADLAKLHFNIGMILANQGEFQQAIVSFQKAVELEPYFGAAHYQLSRINYEAWNSLKGYQFTQDCFSQNISIWEHYLADFTNQPQISALEIGSWEGMSTCWLLENILTHQSAKITCIDTFASNIELKDRFKESNYSIESVEERFEYNIALTGVSERVEKIVGKSQEVLRSLPLNSYNFVYINGSHLASNVLEDAVLCWRLIKIGGLIIFNDYNFCFAECPHQNTSVGIDAFLTVFQDKVKVVHQLYQVIVEKIAE